MLCRSVRAPQTAIHGLQSFLHLLRDHDWSSEPLVVDINSDILEKAQKQSAVGDTMHEIDTPDVTIDTNSVMRDVRSYMLRPSGCSVSANGVKEEKASHPSRRRVMVILTPYECMKGKLAPDEYFSRTPDEKDVALLVKTASASLSHIELLLDSPAAAYEGKEELHEQRRWLQVFAVNTKRFDVVFSVNQKFATHSLKRIQKKAAVNDEAGRKTLLCGFQPVLHFIASAEQRGIRARFYHDLDSGDRIGVNFAHTLADLNERDALVSDMLEIGNGLIEM